MIKDNYTTRQVGRICHVTVTAVINWINSGVLQAFKTIGGHRRVLRKDLIDFLINHKFPIPAELEFSEEKQILIIDDDKKFLQSIITLLKKEIGKCKIHTASDGFEAGRAFTKIKPYLIFLNLKLQGIDGFKICKLIRKYENKSIIITMDSSSSDENKRKALSAGANHHFTKPPNVEELLNTVKKLYGKIY